MRVTARSFNIGAESQTSRAAVVAGKDAKSLVMAAIGELVDDGKADWSRTAKGEIELRLLTGEVFLLGEVAVTRVA